MNLRGSSGVFFLHNVAHEFLLLLLLSSSSLQTFPEAPIQLNSSVQVCLRVEFLHAGHDEAFRSCSLIEPRLVEEPVIHYWGE